MEKALKSKIRTIKLFERYWAGKITILSLCAILILSFTNISKDLTDEDIKSLGSLSLL